MRFYIIKNSNGMWVRSGRKIPFTNRADLADRYTDREVAQANCCGNEWVEEYWV